MASDLKPMLASIASLSAVQRYSQSKLATPESVLEHSGFVSLLAYYIGHSLNLEGAEIDVGTLLCKAIVHDIDEIITGDIARPIKYSSDKLRDLIGTLECEAVQEIDESLGMNGGIYATWIDAKHGTEGAIVALCDSLAVLYKCHDEIVGRGNLTMSLYSEEIGVLVEKKVDALELLLQHESQFLDNVVVCSYAMMEQIVNRREKSLELR